jgi:hypothetical protein
VGAAQLQVAAPLVDDQVELEDRAARAFEGFQGHDRHLAPDTRPRRG